MPQAHTLVNSLTCVPPPLPNYLSRIYTLRTIVGVPTDEDVKQIHDVIRAVNHLSNVPEMYDPQLSNQLAQFLFNAQMAVYRSQYPLTIFPEDTTYTPPTIPSHIPISLEPIVGAPSDEEVHSVRKAIRTVESLANTPFVVGPMLGTKLSQYLFDIQFARYLRDSIQGRLVQAPIQTQSSSLEESSQEVPNDIVDETRTGDEQEMPESVPARSGLGEPTRPGPAIPSRSRSGPNTITPPNNGIHDPRAISEEISGRLGGIEELLKDIRRALVGTHNNLVRNSSSYEPYVVMNEKGELPWLNKLPVIAALDSNSLYGSFTDAQIVAYFKWYRIGEDLIETNGEDKLKPGSENAARSLLARFLYQGYLTTST